jgi:hypothetical protein
MSIQGAKKRTAAMLWASIAAVVLINIGWIAWVAGSDNAYQLPLLIPITVFVIGTTMGALRIRDRAIALEASAANIKEGDSRLGACGSSSACWRIQ